MELPFEIDVATVKELQGGDESFLFLDCREPAEYAVAKIEGTTLIPMNEIPTKLDELATHKDSRIIVHCHHGGRSAQVANYLRGQGFAGAQNMTGGIDVWSLEIDNSVPRY